MGELYYTAYVTPRAAPAGTGPAENLKYMLEHLFGSKTRVKLLRALYRDPDRSFFVRELARALDVQINAVRREIEVLATIGVLKEVEEKRGVDEEIKAGATLRKYYRLDKGAMLYSELQALLLKEQLMGEEQFVKDLKEKIGTPELLILTGRFTRDERAPSDVLIVGNDIKDKVVARLVADYEKDFGFPIRYTIMDHQEFTDRRYVMDKFLFSLFEANHVKVVNAFDI